MSVVLFLQILQSYLRVSSNILEKRVSSNILVHMATLATALSLF